MVHRRAPDYRTWCTWLTIATCLSAFTVATRTAPAQTGVMLPSAVSDTAPVGTRVAHASPSSSGMNVLPEDIAKLKLAPGHVLQMSVFNAPEMTETLFVDDTGNVDVPLVGLVHVEGDSIREAEHKIAESLVQQQFMYAPDVRLQVTAFSPHFVVVAGEVLQPGRLSLMGPSSLFDVLAQAGGLTTAAGGDIELRHTGADGQVDVKHVAYANSKEPDAARAALVYPGDSIFVRRAGVVFVLGAVNRPGGYLMVDGGSLTLPQAIAFAGGTTPVAALSNAIILQHSGTGYVRVEVKLGKQEQAKLAPQALHDGDMIFVPTSKVKSTLINTSSVLSSAASAAIYAGIYY
jgi:polysaccharide biosynthesis/export protein